MTEGGMLRPSLVELESRITDLAVANAGYVMKLVAATGHVTLCGAGEDAYGIAASSTKTWVPDPSGGGAWTAQASVPCKMQKEGEALIQLLATNQVIAIGDPIMSTAGGTVDKGAWSVPATIAELRSRVGIALEAKAINAGGVIKVQLGILKM